MDLPRVRHLLSTLALMAFGLMGVAWAQTADLEIFMTSNLGGSVAAGETFSYYIIVDNWGPDPAVDVEVYDRMMTEWQKSVSAVGCGIAVLTPGGAIDEFDCNFALTWGLFRLGTFGVHELAPKEAGYPFEYGRAIITIEAVALEAVNLTNHVTVVSDTYDPNPENNTASDHVAVMAASDVELLSTASGGTSITAGAEATLRFVATNNGPSTSLGSSFTASLPPGLSPVSASTTNTDGSPGGACGFEAGSFDGTRVVCNFGLIAPEDDDGTTPFVDNVRNVDVRVFLDPYAMDGTSLLVGGHAATDSIDANSGDNVASASLTVKTRADISLAQTASSVIPAGGTGSILLAVEAAGPSVARGVVLTHNVAEGLRATSAIGLLGAASGCAVSSISRPGDTVTCHFGDMEPDDSVQGMVAIDVAADATLTPGTTVKGTTWVSSGTSDPWSGNNAATASMLVGEPTTAAGANLIVQPGPANPAGTISPEYGQSNVPVVQATLSAADRSDDVMVHGVTLAVSENTSVHTADIEPQATDMSAIASVSAYLDANEDGSIGPGDTLVGSVASMDVLNGVIYVEMTSPLRVSPGAPATVLVAYDISEDPNAGLPLAPYLAALPLGLFWLLRRRRRWLATAAVSVVLVAWLAGCASTSGPTTTTTMTLASRMTQVQAEADTIEAQVGTSGLPIQGATVELVYSTP